MTTSYNLSPKPVKLLILHGLNNNLDSFYPMRDFFVSCGFDVSLIILPGHGEDRSEMDSLEEAEKCFAAALEQHVGGSYYVLAFSMGALFYQLWLKKNIHRGAIKQFLLAPAIRLNYQNIVFRGINFVPSKLTIPSRGPKNFQRYSKISIREYQTLFQAVAAVPSSFSIPTQVVIDKRDELVNARFLKLLYPEQVQVIARKLPRRELGSYHLLFHPAYFIDGEWNQLMGKIRDFFTGQKQL